MTREGRWRTRAGWLAAAGALVLLAAAAQAVPPKVYGLPDFDEAPTACVALPDGLLIVGGQHSPTAAPRPLDALLLRVSPTGAIEWDVTVGGPENDYLYTVAERGPGDLIAVGETDHPAGMGVRGCWMVGFTSEGTIEFETTSDAVDSAACYSVSTAGLGDTYVVGVVRSNQGLTPPSHAWLARLDPSGGIRWQVWADGQVSESSGRVLTTADDGALVLTRGSECCFGGWDVYVTRFDDRGAVAWSTVIGGGVTDNLNDALELPDGSFVLVGNRSAGLSENFLWLVKLAADGSGASEVTIDCAFRVGADRVFLNGDRELVVFAWQNGAPSAVVLRLDQDLAILDAVSNGAPGILMYRAVALPDGRFATVGNTQFLGQSSTDANIVWIGPDGRAEDACWGNAVTCTPTYGTPMFADLPRTVSPGPLVFNTVAWPAVPHDRMLTRNSCPPPPPDEVQGVRVSREGADILLTWSSEPLADTYEVYRGRLPDVTPVAYNHASVGACGIVPTTWTDAAERDSGLDRYYLVVARNAVGRGPYGFSSLGTPTPAPPAPCPETTGRGVRWWRRGLR